MDSHGFSWTAPIRVTSNGVHTVCVATGVGDKRPRDGCGLSTRGLGEHDRAELRERRGWQGTMAAPIAAGWCVKYTAGPTVGAPEAAARRALLRNERGHQEGDTVPRPNTLAEQKKLQRRQRRTIHGENTVRTDENNDHISTTSAKRKYNSNIPTKGHTLGASILCMLYYRTSAPSSLLVSLFRAVVRIGVQEVSSTGTTRCVIVNRKEGCKYIVWICTAGVLSAGRSPYGPQPHPA